MNMPNLTQKEVEDNILSSSKTGDLAKFKEFFDTYYVNKHKSIFSSFINIFSKDPILNINIIAKCLVFSAMYGHKNIVEEIINDKKFIKNINNDHQLTILLVAIISPDRLKLHQPSYESFKDIINIIYEKVRDQDVFHLSMDRVLLQACENNDLNVVKYIFESPLLKNSLTFEKGHQIIKITDAELLEYLIFQHDLDKVDKFFWRVERNKTVQSILDKKNLIYELEDNLPTNEVQSNSTKRIKI